MTQDYILRMQNYLKEIYHVPILENFLELQIDEITGGKAVYHMKIKDLHSNIYGFIHGGTLASVADIAMGVSCITLGKRVVTLDMNISYVKNAPTGSTITAVGEVISDGRTIMRTAGQIYHGQQLLARSQASYFVTGDFFEDDPPKMEKQMDIGIPTNLWKNSRTFCPL